MIEKELKKSKNREQNGLSLEKKKPLSPVRRGA
jgi:hypothetical protein